MRRGLAGLLIVLTVALIGCGSSEAEPPPGSIPTIPPGRSAPGETDVGKANPMPAPPRR